MEFKEGKARHIDNVAAGMFLIDTGTVSDTSGAIMRKRQQLSEEGMFVFARIKVQSGERFGPPDMVSRGFVGSQVQNGLLDEPGIVVMKALEQTAKQRSTNWGELLAAFGAA